MVNWNGGKIAVESAISVARQTLPSDLWVVDNGSSDGSPDAIVQACPQVKMIRNPVGRGYAAANNQALEAIGECDYLLLINNDIIFPQEDCIAKVVDYFDKNPEASGACGRYEYPDGRFQRYYNRLPTAFNMMVSWGFARHYHRFLASPATSSYLMLYDDFDQTMNIEQPAFSCVFMRRSCQVRTGPFDERFPLFFVDVDYSKRCRQNGYTWRYFPDWRVVHHQAYSINRMSSWRHAELGTSILNYADKHFRFPKKQVIILLAMVELAWGKYRHRAFDASLLDIYQRKHFFTLDKKPQ